MRRLRRHVAGLLVAPALCGAIAVHHGGMAMGEMHHDGTGAVIELCVGLAVGAAVAALAPRRRSLKYWPGPLERAHVGVARMAIPPTPDARAGPPALLLCVWRR